jgi:hypothetical protein
MQASPDDLRKYRKILNTLKSALHRSLSLQGQGLRNDGKMGNGMYLKKVNGPRSVTLADGSVMTQSDLPSANTRRWVASRKAAVVRGVAYGLITQSDALKRYQISSEEFHEWVRAVSEHGEDALKATALQKYRQP